MISDMPPLQEGIIIGDGGPGGLVKEMTEITEQQEHEYKEFCRKLEESELEKSVQDIKTDWTQSLKFNSGGTRPRDLESLEILELQKSLREITKKFRRNVRITTCIIVAIALQWVCMIIYEIITLKYMT